MEGSAMTVTALAAGSTLKKDSLKFCLFTQMLSVMKKENMSVYIMNKYIDPIVKLRDRPTRDTSDSLSCSD